MPTPRQQPTPAELAALARLTHFRWLIPVLAACSAAPLKGLKHATFLHRLAISRDTLGRTLAAALAQGWLTHNPGVGHPLRPEYILTPAGLRIGPAAARTLRALADDQTLGLNKWSLPVLAAVAAGHDRFSDLRRALPDATARALSLTLQDLCAARLLSREILDTFPPTTTYRLTPRARRPASAARALARVIGLHRPLIDSTPLDDTESPLARSA